MPVNLSIKHVPDEIAERLRQQAKLHHRSVQGELMAILEESLRRPRALTIEEVYQGAIDLGLKTESDSVEIIRELRDSR